MMNIRQRSVNVAREKLLEALKSNRAKHAKEYAEALVAFKKRLLSDLEAALLKVDESEPAALKDFEIEVDFPANHDEEFSDIIDMLSHSTDSVINIDSESFKAYFNNEWSWTSHFKSSVSNYASGSFLKG
jgi:hypothetical protein